MPVLRAALLSFADAALPHGRVAVSEEEERSHIASVVSLLEACSLKRRREPEEDALLFPACGRGGKRV